VIGDKKKHASKKKGTDLFIDINFAKACDMTYSSPEAWRKYLLDAINLFEFQDENM
jgi:hypothetical protein